MSVKQISVFVENQPGKLEKFAEVLTKNNINMLALQLAEAEDFGIVRIIVNDSYEAACVLKDAGYVLNVTEVLAVEIANKPGGLYQVLTSLRDAGVNIAYAYAFTTGQKESAYMIFRVEDIARASELLTLNGIKVLSREDVENM